MMKAYFWKKYIFLFCFLGGLFAFSGYHIYEKRNEFGSLLERLAEASDFEQVKDLAGEISEVANRDVTENAFTELYGMTQDILNRRECRNFSFVKGEKGMIYYGAVIRNEDDQLMEYAKRVGRAARCAKERGAETIFVMPPTKVMYSVMGEDRELPVNDTNAIQDELLLYLQQNQVRTLDLRGPLENSGMMQEELFYRTDHMWTSEAAFVAAGALVDKIRDDFDDDWDTDNFYCSRDNYHADVYHRATIGAIGRETGIAYAGKDDYTVLYPKFETGMKWYDLESGERKAGSFYEAFIDLNPDGEGRYENPGSAVYLEGVVNRDRIVNTENPDGPEILCLRDTYMSPVACFLAPMCSQIDLVWARSNYNDIDYEKLIREEEYDYLIIEVYPYNISERAFAFFED